MSPDRAARWLFAGLVLCGCFVGIARWSKSAERGFAAQVVHAASEHWIPSPPGIARQVGARSERSNESAAARERRSSAPSANVAGRSRRACTPEPERCDGVDNDCDGIRDEPAAEGCAAAYVDRDRDGFGGAVAGCLCIPPQGLVSNGLDCDDARPDVHPGLRELCDGQVDNDCDGATDFCGALPHRTLAAGDLAIRAVQDHMNDVDDELCEWFEIENRTAHTFELMGLEIRDDAFDGFRIGHSLVLGPGGRVVLGRTGDARTNGGVAVDYVYSDFILSNAGDSIELRSDARVIDRITYSAQSEGSAPAR